MGFGWLFIGYVMSYMMSFTKYSHGIVLFGCLLMWHGISMLGRHNERFAYATYPLLALAFVKLYMSCALANELFGMGLSVFDGAIYTVFEVFEYLSSAAFHIFLLLAVKSIASDLELPRQSNAAQRNMVITTMYYVFALLWMLPLNIPNDVRSGVLMFLLLARLLWAVLDLVLIYSCYMYICPAGDEDMPLKRSRFEFINRFREETARREQKAADENVALFKENRDRRRKKKSQKNKRKK